MPEAMRFVGDYLTSSDWSESEKWVIKWQYGLLGDFGEALANAISRADELNLFRLTLGFETEVIGFIAWSRGDPAQRLRAAGLDI